MKIEIGPSGIVKIDTDAAQAIAGTFPIHVEEIGENEYSKADHTALEIKEAIKASIMPVLFLKTELEEVVCLPSVAARQSDDIDYYEFKGFSTWYGNYIVAIDRDGKAFLPR